MNTCLEKYQKLGSFSHWHFCKFHDFFGIDFRIVFFIDFLWKMALKMVRQNPGGEAFFSSFSRPCLLCCFYVELGSLLAPFWRPLAHFGLPLAHFWCPFWLTFGALWLTFGALGSLLVILAQIFSLLVPPDIIFLTSFYNMDGVPLPKPAHRHFHT